MRNLLDTPVDIEKFLLPEDQLEVKYGLPRQIKFCSECNISNQQPMSSNEFSHSSASKKETLSFGENGVCRACEFNKLKRLGDINWKEREKELEELCNKYRNSEGSYDCIVGGSGGKDSAMQSHLLKYKFGMNPLTVTWAPHIYTEIGLKNFHNWINVGGFDNYLFTPNGRIHRLLTHNATINLLHPFQPFILGQKTFATKMALKFNIPLIFYGEMPGEYGEMVSHETSGFAKNRSSLESEGYSLDFLAGRDQSDLLIGGKKISDYLDDGISLGDLSPYLPPNPNLLIDRGVEFKYLGYYIEWVPQEAYYYAVENTGFEANPVRTEGTYSKYNSLDDKIDGFFYYTRYIKFGVGRAMMDSAQEIRNGHIDKFEGQALMKKYEGEFPERYADEFFDYIGVTREQFSNLCDHYRSPHLWMNEGGKWELRKRPWDMTNQ